MGMRISSLLIGVAIISILFSLFYGMTGDLADEYDINIDDSYKNDFEKMNNITDQISGDYETVGNWSVDETSFLGLSVSSISLVKNMIFSPFSVMGELINSIEEHLGIPRWLVTFISTVMLILLVFALVALIQKYRYT